VKACPRQRRAHRPALPGPITQAVYAKAPPQHARNGSRHGHRPGRDLLQRWGEGCSRSGGTPLRGVDSHRSARLTTTRVPAAMKIAVCVKYGPGHPIEADRPVDEASRPLRRGALNPFDTNGSRGAAPREPVATARWCSSRWARRPWRRDAQGARDGR
jgi:hypothetical protein